MAILPDPNNTFNGEYGPGFKSVSLISNQPVLKSRTNSGRVVTRAKAAQYWEINISYNPMTREEFDIVYSFLLAKRGGLIPFEVSLPQYLLPKDTALTGATVTSLINAGSNTINYVPTGGGVASPGDLFTVSDDLYDSSHTKAYKVTSVDAGELSISPPVSREISAAATLDFVAPLVRVIMKSPVQEYKLGTNNLYEFSLNLEEVQT